MVKVIIKLLDKGIVVLLGVAGVFSACEKKSDCGCVEGPYPMYGPPASYGIRGTVTNKANSKPIPNIRIIRKISADYADTSYTDSKGSYALNYYWSDGENDILLKLEDIDGEENGGEFATKEINVKLTDAEKEKMEECYQKGGRFFKTQNIELKKSSYEKASN